MYLIGRQYTDGAISEHVEVKPVNTTWDGQPISPDPPYGASIIVYRLQEEVAEFLILHRAWHEPNDQGDWAWTPPSGARHPNEAIEGCAKRELAEETGLSLTLQRANTDDETWAVFFAEAEADAQIKLDAEHDQYAWVSLTEAIHRCKPAQVGNTVAKIGKLLDLA